MDNNFYVYHLIDPLTNLPFYVGKGQGRRMYFHEYLARRGRKSNNNGHLYNKINKVLRDSTVIEYRKVLENVDEALCKRDALKLRHKMGLMHLNGIEKQLGGSSES